jgi:hypothetical protein
MPDQNSFFDTVCLSKGHEVQQCAPGTAKGDAPVLMLRRCWAPPSPQAGPVGRPG